VEDGVEDVQLSGVVEEYFVLTVGLFQGFYL
jgi:hypothetical protein